MSAATSSDDIPFDRGFDGKPGELVRLSPRVRRMVAGNAGPMTFTGTCTYVVGEGEVAVIDPGPDDPVHIAALLDALRNETVTHVLVTHTHRDHSPAALRVKAATGATIAGCAPHVAARELALGEINRLDAANDLDYAPDLLMREGDRIEGKSFALEAIETPGHTMNHLAFALPEEAVLFSGDHVMAWSTSVVAPPDGAMSAYMASLDKLRAREERLYWPGHGGAVKEPQRFVRALANHRRLRETAILGRLAAGDRSIDAIVAKIYEGLNPALRGAAALSVFAHLEDLVARGLAAADGPLTLQAVYRKV